MYKKSFLNEIDFPLPEYVRKENGICPNWILPLDQLEIGVEIECNDQNDVLWNGRSRNIGSYHSRSNKVHPSFLSGFKGKKWKVESDGSLGEKGVEFVSPILKGSEGIDNVVNNMKILKRMGFDVDSKCGLHIHIGLSSICGNKRVDDVVSFLCRLNKSFFNYQGSLYGSAGKVRRDREFYCSRLRKEEDLIILSEGIEKKEKGNKDNSDFDRFGNYSRKYRGLNLSNLRNGIKGKRSSIEFRFPSGSLDHVQFLVHMIQIIFLIRQSWVDRHSRKGSDSVCNDWNLSKGFQSDPKKEGYKGFKFLSRKIKNSIRGKWLEWENGNINYHWEDIFELWESQSKEYDNQYFN